MVPAAPAICATRWSNATARCTGSTPPGCGPRPPADADRLPPTRKRTTSMEMSTPENEELVARVYTEALEARADGRKLSAADTVIYEIEMLSQEVNSGASFEQYFRWASTEEIGRVVDRL